MNELSVHKLTRITDAAEEFAKKNGSARAGISFAIGAILKAVEEANQS